MSATTREIPSDTPCPRCLKAGRQGVFLAELTAIDGRRSLHMLRCRHSRCGYVRILSAHTESETTPRPLRLRPGFWATVLVSLFVLAVTWQVLLILR